MKLAFVVLTCLFSANLYAASPNLEPASSVPRDNATGVALNSDIELDFDSNILNTSTSALIELYEEGGALVESFSGNGTFLFGGSAGGVGIISGDRITLSPGSDFIAGRGYYIIIPVGSEIREFVVGPLGDLVTPVTDPTTYNFATLAATSDLIRNVPTVSHWGLGMLVVMMGWLGMYRRRKG